MLHLYTVGGRYIYEVRTLEISDIKLTYNEMVTYTLDMVQLLFNF